MIVVVSAASRPDQISIINLILTITVASFVSFKSHKLSSSTGNIVLYFKKHSSHRIISYSGTMTMGDAGDAGLLSFWHYTHEKSFV
jgi:hypothetical protein